MSGAPQPFVGGLQIRRPTRIDAGVRELLKAKNVCVVCTQAKDGTIHAQPVWVDTDGDSVLLNSVPGRAWLRNLERDARVTCTVTNLANPYEFVEIRGRAVISGGVEAERHIHLLARKYLDLDEYPFLSPDEPRALVEARPERIVHVLPEATDLDS